MKVDVTADRQSDYSCSNSPPSGGKSNNHCLIEHLFDLIFLQQRELGVICTEQFVPKQ
jgi:hypothetical protein